VTIIITVTFAEPEFKPPPSKSYKAPSSKSSKVYSSKAFSKASYKASKSDKASKSGNASKSGKASKARLSKLQFQTQSVPESETLHPAVLNNAGVVSSPRQVVLAVASFSIVLLSYIWCR